MTELINFIVERPWIVFAALGIALYLSMMRLLILQRRKRRAYQALDRLVEEEILSNVYLKVHDGRGDFYDVHVTRNDEESSAEIPLLFNNQVLTPALLLPEGDYTIRFKVKVHEFPTGYVSVKGLFTCNIRVLQGEDSILTFDTETLSGHQEAMRAEDR